MLLVACGGDKKDAAAGGEAPADAADIKADKGVDLAKKVVRFGTLNDESGPAATIGKPYALGKRILVEQVNAGGTGLLPEGWTVELVEKDHGYNPQKAVQAYNQIKNDVLLIATSFGTPNTLPLRPMLKRDKLVALPASLSSEMAKHPYTPPGAPSYVMEAMRAMDFVVDEVKKAGKDAASIKAGIIYQQDDYGMDGLSGWKQAAEHHGVTIVSEQTVTPGQRDFAAVVTALKDAGASHVMLTVLPSASAPILATASQLLYKPVWMGQSPSWVDRFFDPEVIPAAVFETYHRVDAAPYWGEKLPGMDKFLAAYEKYGRKHMKPDGYILGSYLQGVAALEATKRAIEAGDLTRNGVLKAMQSIDNWRPMGMAQPISLTSMPYVTATATRVSQPDFANKTWKIAADYASPAALGKSDTATTAAAGVTDPKRP